MENIRELFNRREIKVVCVCAHASMMEMGVFVWDRSSVCVYLNVSGEQLPLCYRSL